MTAPLRPDQVAALVQLVKTARRHTWEAAESYNINRAHEHAVLADRQLAEMQAVLLAPQRAGL